MTEVLGADAVKQCVGRFCFSVPASMARYADAYSVQGITLEEVAWDVAVKDPWEQEWIRRLQEIEGLKAQRVRRTHVHGTVIEQRMLIPDRLKAVLFYSRGHTSIVAWGAVLNAGAAGLWLRVDASPEYKEEVAKVIADVAAVYRLAETGVEPPRGAFHLRGGVISAPFKPAGENAEASFKGHPLELDLEVITNTTSRPDTKGLMERFVTSLAISGLSGGGVRPIRNRTRVVAGLAGEEMILKTSDGGDTGLGFIWTTPGEAGSGKHPRIKIKMDSTYGRADDKIAIWDALLDSMQPAP